MKYLLFIAMFVIVLPINGQKESPKPNGQQTKSGDINKPSPTPIQQLESSENKNGAKDDPKSYLQRLFSPENLPNIGLFIAGIIGIVIAVCTLKSINKQAGVMEGQLKEMQSDQRAWIGIPQQSIKATVFALPEGGIRIEHLGVTLENTGKTPALKLAAKKIITGGKYGDPIPDFDSIMDETVRKLNKQVEILPPAMAATAKAQIMTDLFPEGGVIPPNGTQSVDIVSGYVAPNQDRTAVIYFLVKVTYYDIFTNTPKRTTKICLMNYRGTDITICPEGNCMT